MATRISSGTFIVKNASCAACGRKGRTRLFKAVLLFVGIFLVLGAIAVVSERRQARTVTEKSNGQMVVQAGNLLAPKADGQERRTASSLLARLDKAVRAQKETDRSNNLADSAIAGCQVQVPERLKAPFAVRFVEEADRREYLGNGNFLIVTRWEAQSGVGAVLTGRFACHIHCQDGDNCAVANLEALH